MIIVPTEKQFDWRHAPVVLFCIVLLNVIIYFFYQAGDSEKAQDAVLAYEESGYIDQEWPLFKTFLSDHQETQTLADAQEAFDNGYPGELASLILIRRDFYVFLQDQAEDTFSPEFYRGWQLHRPDIQSTFNSLSYVAHGLSAAFFKPSALLTHQFLHGGVMHLLGNMFFLVVCGFAVEAAVGHWKFLLFYLLCGVGAGLAQVAADTSSAVPLVGASGAISGVMAMYLAVFRLQKIEFFYWIFFFVGYIRAPALLILPFYIGKEIFSFYTEPDSNVAFLAHTGGFVTGAVLIGIALWLNPRTINREYVETDTSVDPSRKMLAAVYEAIEGYRFTHALRMVENLIVNQGLDFELARLRYNLYKLDKRKGYGQSLLQLLRLKHLLPHEVEQLEKIWLENPGVHHKLDDETAIKLGMQFASSHSPESADAIFSMLERRQCRRPEFGVLAQKLAGVYAQLNQPKKQQAYQSIAQQFMEEGFRGTL